MRLRPLGMAGWSTLIALGLLSSVAAQDDTWINPDESVPNMDTPSTEMGEGVAATDQGSAEAHTGSARTLWNDETAAAGSIPRGQMPPPGSCRVWFPNRPPGQQPPPGPCDQVATQVPPGGVLVRR